MKRFLPAVVLAAVVAPAHAAMFLINSQASYLRAGGEAPAAALAIDLNANGFTSGQTVFLSRVGSFNHLGGGASTDFGLSAVFSSTNAILGPSQLNRVPGAIAAGPGWVSPTTQVGGFTTDIAEDFEVCDNSGSPNGITLTIPTGALFLVAAAEDNFFSDNNNAPEFYIKIQPVPEPAACMALGCLVLGIARKRKA